VGRGINRRLELGAPGTGSSLQYLGRTATAATMGGTVTAISGGKFGNGAATAAFMHVVNAEVTSALDKRIQHLAKLKNQRQRAYQDKIGSGRMAIWRLTLLRSGWRLIRWWSA